MKYIIALILFSACNVASKVPLSHDDSHAGRVEYWESRAKHYKQIVDTTKNYSQRIHLHSMLSFCYEQAAISGDTLSRIMLRELKTDQ